MPSTYFARFSPLLYPNRDRSVKIVSNIFTRVQFTLEARIDRTLYYDYVVKESDRPETVAYKYYGSPDYHWVVLLANDILDPFYDWPMAYLVFEKYIMGKYGDTLGADHHYETLELKAPADGYGYTSGDIILDGGIPCASDFEYSYEGYDFGLSAVSVSNYDYEFRLNEEKRNIQLLNKEHLAEFISEFEILTGGKE